MEGRDMGRLVGGMALIVLVWSGCGSTGPTEGPGEGNLPPAGEPPGDGGEPPGDGGEPPGDGGEPPGGGAPPDPQAAPFILTTLLDGLVRPVHLSAPEGDPRLFIVEKGGRILVADENGDQVRNFLDLRGSVGSGNEQGLLSVAFHPRYADEGRFFVDYTDTGGTTRIVEYRVSSDPDRADAGSALEILAVDQPFSNHNGGHVAFGPDGMLYVTLGDGGSGGDPLGNGQNRATLLGSILRIDVDAGSPYAVPGDNPFAGEQESRPEIWLWGVRNPWRIAFDPADGSMYVADVGQGQREEVTVVGRDGGGANLGWNILEGTLCFSGPDCSTAGLTLPQVEYDHGEGCSITGGGVYRGSVEALSGHYLYSDYCAGFLRSFRFLDGAPTESTEWQVPAVGNVTSFGEGGTGEMYVLTESSVFRIDPAP